MTLQNNLITFHKPTSPEIGGGTVDDSNYVKKTGENQQLIVSETYFQATALQSFRFSLGGPQQFAQYKKFEIYNAETIAYTPFKCVNNLGLQTNLINSFTNVDLVFQRNGVEYMKFTTSGTLDVNDNVSLRSNTYDSVGNANVSFRRNFIDFFYLRNNEVELASAITLNADNSKINTINTVGDNDMVFQRNGVEYFKLNGAQNIIDVATGRALSSQYIYADFFRARNYGVDMVFEGGNTTDDGRVEFMRYRKADEDAMFSKDAYVIQDKRLYFHKGTNVNSYISSANASGVNHTALANEDPNGELRFITNGSFKMFIRANDMTLGAGVIFSGDFNDISSEKVKYDIKDADYDFTSIVKNIKPQTFRLKKEKEIGMNKNHIGLIAENVEENMPKEVENIVNVNQDGIKTLNYIKLTSFLWGAVREQQTKIEHLEATMFEMMEEIKELKGNKKTKAKAKAKN